MCSANKVFNLSQIAWRVQSDGRNGSFSIFSIIMSQKRAGLGVLSQLVVHRKRGSEAATG